MITKTYTKEAYFGKPDKLFDQMTKDGFRFTRTTCPFKLAEPKDIEVHNNGDITYTQWTADEWAEMVAKDQFNWNKMKIRSNEERDDDC